MITLKITLVILLFLFFKSSALPQSDYNCATQPPQVMSAPSPSTYFGGWYKPERSDIGGAPIPKENLVVIKIYDLSGKEVAVLLNEFKPAGNYVVTFNGSNLSSGIYFYRLTSGEFTDTKRMILVK